MNLSLDKKDKTKIDYKIYMIIIIEHSNQCYGL